MSFATIIGSTVLRCLVNSVSFIRLLGVSRRFVLRTGAA